VLYTTSHSYGATERSTLRNFVLPGPIVKKLGVIDYVGDPYAFAILVELDWMGNSPKIDEI